MISIANWILTKLLDRIKPREYHFALCYSISFQFIWACWCSPGCDICTRVILTSSRDRRCAAPSSLRGAWRAHRSSATLLATARQASSQTEPNSIFQKLLCSRSIHRSFSASISSSRLLYPYPVAERPSSQSLQPHPASSTTTTSCRPWPRPRRRKTRLGSWKTHWLLSDSRRRLCASASTPRASLWMPSSAGKHTHRLAYDMISC